jgi:hypothetical protein
LINKTIAARLDGDDAIGGLDAKQPKTKVYAEAASISTTLRSLGETK